MRNPSSWEFTEGGSEAGGQVSSGCYRPPHPPYQPDPHLVEGVSEADHHYVNVVAVRVEGGRLYERRRQQIAAECLQVVREPAIRISARARQDLVVGDTLPNAPTVVDEVAEVRDVEANLPRMLGTAQLAEDVLNDAQVDAVHKREE